MRSSLLLAVGGLVLASAAQAGTIYVDPSSPSDGPGTNWATAFHTIQPAIDAAVSNDTVLVTNGAYATGGKAVYNNFTNRIAIDKPITVQSVNGPDVTTIVGQGPLGPDAIRCAYVGTNATLAGFTLTNGSTRTSGDYIKEQRGGGVWCEDSAIVSNCTLSGNSAYYYGGGAAGGTLNNCTLSANSAQLGGGGAYTGTLNNCTLSGNSASSGGGAYASILNNCMLSGNSADGGGGAYEGTLNNCTLSGNSAYYDGGGAYGGTLNNCIVYYNFAPLRPNHRGASLSYCCTSPDPGGTGNITEEPKLTSPSHIATNSPCVGAGSSDYVSGTDIDGDPWMNPPSIGCDQPIPGSITGMLAVAITASYTNVDIGFLVDFAGAIQGKVSANAWDFGDGTEQKTNAVYVSHAFASPGSYSVTLWAYNETHPEGVAATVTVHVVTSPIHYVNASNATPLAPYLSWTNAAINIQNAIDACVLPGETVLVTNGIYATGGKAIYNDFTNRIAIDKPITVRSVNGPDVTTIVGQGPLGQDAIRCAYVGTNAMLVGFTLTNGSTRTSGDGYKEQRGGGVWCEDSAIVSNCMLSGNLAKVCGGGAYGGTLNNCTLSGNSADSGGGAAGGTLNNCTLSANSAQLDGGGALDSTLNNCTLSANSANTSGGAGRGTLNNCTLSANSAKFYGGGALDSTLNNCMLSGNSAEFGGGGAYCTLNNCTLSANLAGSGGGAYKGTLNNCTLSGNSAEGGGGASFGILNNCSLSGNSAGAYGGGAYNGTLNNCSLSANSAGSYGGGACFGAMNNCIVYHNSAPIGPNHHSAFPSYCCTSPDPGGTGNITNEPCFMDGANGDFRLRYGSPCIDAGANLTSAGITTDILGTPRPLDGNWDGTSSFDMGAYEYNPQTSDSSSDGIPDWWCRQYGLDPNSAGVATNNPDSDPYSTFQEWIAGTDPTNSLSFFEILSLADGPPFQVFFPSLTNRCYTLYGCTDLIHGAWSPIPGQSNIAGGAGTASLIATNPPAGSYFYRIGVTLP